MELKVVFEKEPSEADIDEAAKSLSQKPKKEAKPKEEDKPITT
jgi:hypothetical protein